MKEKPDSILFSQAGGGLGRFVEKHGGIEKVQKLIADSLERTGLSPRYTRPDEKKKDIFPPKEKDENRVFAKDLMGNKHYYYRFYNETALNFTQWRRNGSSSKQFIFHVTGLWWALTSGTA